MKFTDRNKAIEYCKTAELPIEIKKQTRSGQQNRALHLFFRFVSESLNDIGLTFNYTGIKGMTLETRYTEQIVKDFIRRPIQIAMFDKQSTTEITTHEINEIIDVITKFFADRGVEVNFPSEFGLYLKLVE